MVEKMKGHAKAEKGPSAEELVEEVKKEAIHKKKEEEITKIKNLAEKSLFVYFLQKMDFY